MGGEVNHSHISHDLKHDTVDVQYRPQNVTAASDDKRFSPELNLSF